MFHYAQEMFDGLKAFRGADGKIRFFRLDRHCQPDARRRRAALHPGDRRGADARRRSWRWLRADRDWVPSAPGTALYIRPTIIATEPFLGVRPAKRFLFFVIASPVGAYSGEAFSPARILVEDNYVRAAAGGLGGVKAGANYIASLRAAEDAKARGYAQVLWTDAIEHTYLEEVGTMNLVVRIGDEFITPPLGGSILAGITRDSVMTLLRDWGLLVNERPMGMEELIARAPRRHAARGVRLRHRRRHHAGGHARLEGRGHVINDGKPGEMSRRLFDAITGVQCGTRARHARLDDPARLMAVDRV